ncbi:hypothetical protein D3C80_1688840 [compost metagenome]
MLQGLHRCKLQDHEIIIGIQGMNLPVAGLAQQSGRLEGAAFFLGNQMVDRCNEWRASA